MSTFTVEGFEGITFTAKKDVEVGARWMVIEARNEAGELLQRSGTSVSELPADDVPITPEPVQRDDAYDRGAVAEFIESLAPPEPETIEGEIT